MGKTLHRILFVVMMGLILNMASGCGSKMKHSGFLKDYPDFKPGPMGGADFVYFKEGVDFKAYDKVMLDHVVFYFSKDAKLWTENFKRRI